MRINILLLILGVVMLTSIPYLYTHSFFNDTAVSSSNTFSAVAVSISPTVAPTLTVSVAASHIVISEVQISGATANQDFVEFYNPTFQAINISNFRIRKKTSLGTVSTLALIPTGKVIPAHGFFLWSNSQNGYDISIGTDISNTNTLSDNNSIELQDTNSISVDQVGWGTGTNQFMEGTIISVGPSPLHSIERKAHFSSTQKSMSVGGADEFKGNGSDIDNNSNDFIERTQSQPQNSQSSAESL